MLPRINLSGSADKFLNIYFAFFGIIALALIYFLGRKTGKTAKEVSITGDPVKQSNLTYEKSQYVFWADQLEEAMFPLGTDESAVNKIFQRLKTSDDIKQLIAAFGKRRQQWTVSTTTLPEWLTGELEDSERAELNNIIANNGINFSF